MVENIVALTRFALGDGLEDPFRVWVTAALKRLDRVAPNPVQDFRGRFDFGSEEEYQAHLRQNMGAPLPIDVVDTSKEVAPDALASLYATFLAKVDWAANPYLRSPESLQTAGFSGEPYRA